MSGAVSTRRRSKAAEIAKAAAAAGARRDGLNPLDRDIVGKERAQYRLPLLDVVQVRQDLTDLRAAVDQCLAHLNRVDVKDRAILLTVAGIFRQANALANARKNQRVD